MNSISKAGNTTGLTLTAPSPSSSSNDPLDGGSAIFEGEGTLSNHGPTPRLVHSSRISMTIRDDALLAETPLIAASLARTLSTNRITLRLATNSDQVDRAIGRAASSA